LTTRTLEKLTNQNAKAVVKARAVRSDMNLPLLGVRALHEQIPEESEEVVPGSVSREPLTSCNAP
jgi:hypothetical protein